MKRKASDEGTVTELKDEAQLQGLIGTPGSTLILNFWADWHAPCKSMGRVCSELAADHPAISFVQVEAERFPKVCETYSLQSVPTFVVLKEGKVQETLQEASAPKLVAIAKKISATAGVSVSQKKAEQQGDEAGAKAEGTEAAALDERLNKLIRAASVMVFMKGDSSAPRCKFSKELVGLLKEENIRYGYFDILTDQSVREGLKTFSNWPTYPQVYVGGQLVGGLDVIKDLREAEELDTVFPAEARKEDLQKRLKELINQERVMLFMKGSPDNPQCGFSNKMVSLLRECEFEFGYFNILLDQEVREGLKTYSNWKTYPQLYVDGELVGGLDVCLEMHSEGELADLAKKPIA